MDLSINYEETRNVGNQVSERGSEFQSLLNDIKGINDNLKAAWEGSDSMKYADAVEQQAVTIQQLVDSVNSIGEYLVNVGNAYEQAMEANMSGINN